MANPLFDPLIDTPNFVSQFSAHHHPEREKIASNIQSFFLDRWPWALEETKLRYLKEDLEDLGLLFFHTVPKDRAELATTLHSFFFLYDDILEEMDGTEAKKSFTQLVKIISGDNDVGAMTPIETLVYDLFERVISTGEPALQEMGRSIVTQTITYLKAAGSKQERMKSLSLDFAEFLKYRVDDGGCGFVFALTFWARGLIMPPWLSIDEDFKNLVHAAASHGVLVNDLYSYRVERKRVEEKQGALLMYDGVSFLSQKYGMGLVDAMEELKRYILEQEERYGVVLKRLNHNHRDLPAHLKTIEEFSNALVNVMGGNTIWSGYCGRYNSISDI